MKIHICFLNRDTRREKWERTYMSCVDTHKLVSDGEWRKRFSMWGKKKLKFPDT